MKSELLPFRQLVLAPYVKGEQLQFCVIAGQENQALCSAIQSDDDFQDISYELCSRVLNF